LTRHLIIVLVKRGYHQFARKQKTTLLFLTNQDNYQDTKMEAKVVTWRNNSSFKDMKQLQKRQKKLPPRGQKKKKRKRRKKSIL
jgi:hypothetical protein